MYKFQTININSTLNILFHYITKRRGHKINPWGTPFFSVRRWDLNYSMYFMVIGLVCLSGGTSRMVQRQVSVCAGCTTGESCIATALGQAMQPWPTEPVVNIILGFSCSAVPDSVNDPQRSNTIPHPLTSHDHVFITIWCTQYGRISQSLHVCSVPDSVAIQQ